MKWLKSQLLIALHAPVSVACVWQQCLLTLKLNTNEVRRGARQGRYAERMQTVSSWHVYVCVPEGAQDVRRRETLPRDITSDHILIIAGTVPCVPFFFAQFTVYLADKCGKLYWKFPAAIHRHRWKSHPIADYNGRYFYLFARGSCKDIHFHVTIWRPKEFINLHLVYILIAQFLIGCDVLILKHHSSSFGLNLNTPYL